MRGCLAGRFGACAVALLTATSGVALLGSTGAGAATKAPITIGMLTTLTGAAAADFKGGEQGAQAAIDAQNAKGGVDGHKLVLVVKNAATTPTGASTAVQELISEHVFSLIYLSAIGFLAYKATVATHVPVVGGDVTGPEWEQQPDTNMVAAEGDHDPTLPPNTLYGEVAKLEGAKSMAGLAVDGVSSSTGAAQDAITGAKAAGLETPYYNDSVPLGSANVTSLVLAMKQAGVDSYFSALLDTTNFALMSAAKQAGLKLRAPINASGYSQTLLDTSTAKASAQGGIFSVDQLPVSEHTSATDAEMAAFKKYEHFDGVPNLNWTFGWLSGKLTIEGLEKIGGRATRAKFLAALHTITSWTATGLLPQPSNFSLADFGKTPTDEQCAYFVKLEGSSFVPLDHGKPICGKNVS